MKPLTILSALLVLLSCGSSNKKEQQILDLTEIGQVIRLNDKIREIIREDAVIEILAEGYIWSEGPLWLPVEKKLLWSDVPANTIYAWHEDEGVHVYLKPSGYTLSDDHEGKPGSNGLLLNEDNELVLCQHGDRRVAKMTSPLNDPQANFQTLSDRYEGSRYNSPNDAAFGPGGYLYFTDPPYGLGGGEKDPEKEIPFQGVYRLAPSGEVKLMVKNLSRPNGIAFSPDKLKCYIANSDKNKALWMVYDLDESFNLINEKVFFDVTEVCKSQAGLPDGLKVNSDGILFATGPGGVWVFSPNAEHLGTISTGTAISNCALDEDEKTLFMTSDMYVCRLTLQ